MAKIGYEFIAEETEIINKIDNIDTIAKLHIMEIEELYMEDLFFMSIIDKSVKLIDSFLFALNKRNITVLATLTRIQIDCAIRAFATTMVKDSGDFCESIIIKNKRIKDYVDINNKKLTDKYLCESLGDYLNLPVYELYQKICGFVHFSSDSFHSITKVQEENNITMFISRNNRAEDEKEFERLSIELANQFCFFSSVLIEDIFVSWLEQKRSWNNKKSNQN